MAARIELHEGDRHTVYDDATGQPIVPGSRVVGNPTIGVGTLLSSPGGITEAECRMLFQNRLTLARRGASTLPVYAKLDLVRQNVLVEMVFQLGLGGVKAFTHMLSALDGGDWSAAASEMRHSRWHAQASERVDELATIIETGKP
jgi:lysozyme